MPQKNLQIYFIKHSVAIVVTSFMLCMANCTPFRAVKHGMPSTDSYSVFDLDTIEAANTIATFIETPESDPYFRTAKFSGGRLNGETVGEYFSRVRGNGSLMIIRNDTILLEEYYGNFSKNHISNVFSISKAITSLLCGIAIDEGYIGSVNDSATKYIPELADENPMFADLKLAHLLDMRTGLDFQEKYSWNPFSQMAQLYYGKDLMKFISKAKFKESPGTSHYYNSLSTAILGVIIERATNTPFAEYLEEKVWEPLGMEHDAFVALDSRKHHHAKAYGGIATTTRNIARIGKLYLNRGKYGDRRIVSEEWIDRSTHARLENEAYSYGWNNIISQNNGELYVTPRFFALGLFGQVLFCDPEQNLIFVTLGEKKGCEYQLLFDDFCNILLPMK